MSSQYTLKLNEEQAREMPMVDIAFAVLKAVNTPFYYRDLMAEVAKIKGLTEEQTMDVIAQLYTEINIDGRFACVGTNLWGLKRWYPVEKSEDAVANTKRPRIINDDDDDLDEEVYAEEEYESFDAGEDFDDSEDGEAEDSEFFEDEDLDDEIDEEVEVDEEDEDLDEKEDLGEDEEKEK